MNNAPSSFPDELLPVMDQLARAVHERWMAGKLSDGWRYAPTLSAQEKTHPSLVPYDDLPESEQAYDLNTARQTLETLLSLGYTIQKKEGDV